MNKIAYWLKAIRYHFGLGVYSDKYPSLSMKPVVIAKKRYWKFTDDTMMPTMRALAYMNTLEMFDHRINQEDIEFFCDSIDGQMKVHTSTTLNFRMKKLSIGRSADNIFFTSFL